jgi:hypothetical protein
MPRLPLGMTQTLAHIIQLRFTTPIKTHFLDDKTLTNVILSGVDVRNTLPQMLPQKATHRFIELKLVFLVAETVAFVGFYEVGYLHAVGA